MIRARVLSFAAVIAVAALPGCSDDSTTPNTKKDGGELEVKPLTYDEVVVACAREAACGVKRARLADCVDNYYRRYVWFGQEMLWSSIYRCVNDAKGDCGVIRECLGFKSKPDSCDKNYEPHCENGRAYNCDIDARWVQAVDCKRGGLLCGVKAAGTGKQAVCGGGPCDPTTFRGECRGKRYFQCSSGALEIDDCVARQLQCRDDSVGCEGTGESCLPAGPQCDARNNNLVACVEGYVMRRKCSDVFGKKTCVAGSAKCRGNGTECSASDFDACDGDKLKVCLDGYSRLIDCPGLGLLKCEPTTYGATCGAEQVY
ncbi:MAG: hypothetical protein CSA65_09600 [Proteobacteria bacterium]|nr:MAG: hypothetical protein CSB49_01410 [Pseudomonadota bacterium]PIE17176.1 MAG: hypothetical protein CSA65_09600 [Pseudomonadota bacterium]